ncbi:MAG: hypothetical protein K8L97_06060 [Anaerolineae bacterium]|nr:hypothetical protein [Anaerolineae bacterium]
MKGKKSKKTLTYQYSKQREVILRYCTLPRANPSAPLWFEVLTSEDELSQLSQNEFAIEADIDSSLLSRVLSGERLLTDQQCWKLCENVGLSQEVCNELQVAARHDQWAKDRHVCSLLELEVGISTAWHHYSVVGEPHVVVQLANQAIDQLCTNFKSNDEWVNRVEISYRNLRRIALIQVELTDTLFEAIQEDSDWLNEKASLLATINPTNCQDLQTYDLCCTPIVYAVSHKICFDYTMALPMLEVAEQQAQTDWIWSESIADQIDILAGVSLWQHVVSKSEQTERLNRIKRLEERVFKVFDERKISKRAKAEVFAGLARAYAVLGKHDEAQYYLNLAKDGNNYLGTMGKMECIRSELVVKSRNLDYSADEVLIFAKGFWKFAQQHCYNRHAQEYLPNELMRYPSQNVRAYAKQLLSATD